MDGGLRMIVAEARVVITRRTGSAFARRHGDKTRPDCFMPTAFGLTRKQPSCLDFDPKS